MFSAMQSCLYRFGVASTSGRWLGRDRFSLYLLSSRDFSLSSYISDNILRRSSVLESALNSNGVPFLSLLSYRTLGWGAMSELSLRMLLFLPTRHHSLSDRVPDTRTLTTVSLHLFLTCDHCAAPRGTIPKSRIDLRNSPCCDTFTRNFSVITGETSSFYQKIRKKSPSVDKHRTMALFNIHVRKRDNFHVL